MYSPLDFPHYRQLLKKQNMVIVKNYREADIILSSYLKVLKNENMSLQKKLSGLKSNEWWVKSEEGKAKEKIFN